jgi:serine/threonine-protein kinase RIO1
MSTQGLNRPIAERLIETPAGIIHLYTVEKPDHSLEVTATMKTKVTVHADALLMHDKMGKELVKKAEDTAVRKLISTVLLPPPLLSIVRELNVLCMECLVTMQDTPHLEDLKLKRMVLSDQLGKVQAIVRRPYLEGTYNHGDTGPADDQG